MKKVSGMLVVSNRQKLICAFTVRTHSGDLIDLSFKVNHYEVMDDCIYKCVRIAKENGFEIPYKEDCCGRVYDIAVTEYSAPFGFRKYCVARPTSL